MFHCQIDLANNARVVRSDSFTFLIGPDHVPFIVHAGVVKELSAPLTAMIENGSMKESVERVAVLEDIEIETFGQFCEYAYKGSYTTAEYVERNAETASLTPGWGNPRGLSPTPTAPAETLHPNTALERDFARKFHALSFQVGDASVQSTASNLNPDFLGHAKLYFFTTRYLIQPLRMQCLQSLHRDLCDFKLNKDNVFRIIDLLAYTYTHTSPHEPGSCYLREMVSLYTAYTARSLAKYGGLRELMEENTEIAIDLVERFVFESNIGVQQGYI
ncbi:hypothetical protein BDV25DRAFT_110508 [Aspergillus avenaceus]|uniref:BTB domain-containing protein n=1 Tax=Aspergillus avenaceus TaxID=36643 RepID=A0A5N6TVX1_ASPAV|nr:hypothetical protein BDV25DRAFT_110508 [Aspergillus avenaceus]